MAMQTDRLDDLGLKPLGFKRLVIGLQPGASSASMRFAVELAELMRLDLLGLLLEDGNLANLATIPFAREIRSLGGGWRPIDADQMARDFELAAGSMRRAFAEAAKGLATRQQFDITRGAMADLVNSISRADDIVMIMEPTTPGERATHQFERLIQVALQSAAAVMFVPRRVIRTTGPVVAIMASPDDPSLPAAASIAAEAKEDLILLDIRHAAPDSPSVDKLTGKLIPKPKHIVASKVRLSQPASLQQALQPFHERLVVAARTVFHDGDAAAIAAARGVPVLVIEPQRQ